ncbi:MAG: hypothetical protein HYZ27_01775, partial [Deltaproteobacteria bacterium]|nr:hypothetical protein [Deltaproteobacteria bacterium]
DMPVYAYDPAKCEEEFKLADLDKDGIAAGEELTVDYRAFRISPALRSESE